MTHTPESEMPLEIKKELAKEVHRKNLEKFGLDKNETFRSAFERMKGMDHGPNHSEGDPVVHTQLVEFEVDNFLQIQEHSLSDQGVDLLILSTVLHDIGKADTLKYDVVSFKQNEIVGASEKEIESANKLLKQIIEDVSGESTEGLSKNKLRELQERYGKEVQARLQGAIDEGLGGTKALAVNFRGHDRRSKEISEQILPELDIDLTDEQKKRVMFVVKNHMLFLQPADLNIDRFKELFVDKKSGEIDEEMIEMLRIHAFADGAATIRSGEKKTPEKALLVEIDKKLVELKAIIQADKKGIEIPKELEALGDILGNEEKEAVAKIYPNLVRAREENNERALNGIVNGVLKGKMGLNDGQIRKILETLK